VEKGPEGDREFAANAVRDGGGNQGTNHSSDRELDL
jgi:general stress protein YciG